MMTVKEVIQELKVSKSKIYQMLKDPNCKLRHYIMPYGIRFEEKDIQKYKELYKK